MKNDYDDEYQKSGFKDKLEFKNVNKIKRKRKRNIIWFNLAYDSDNVNDNIGKSF